MATEIFSTADSFGNSAFAPPFARYVQEIDLAAGVAETVNWPIDSSGVTYCYVMFKANDEFRVRVGGAAAFHATGAGDVTDGSGSIPSPAARVRDGETSFSIISATAQIVFIEFFKS